MTVVWRRVVLSSSGCVALTVTVLTMAYAGLRPAGPGFGRFGYSYEYDMVWQVLYPVALALCLVDILFWRGRWVELAAPTMRALALRLALCGALLAVAVASVYLVWLTSRAADDATASTRFLGDGGQLNLAVGNLTLTFAFACFVGALFGPSAASLTVAALLVAELAVGGTAGTQCHPTTALQLCPPSAPVSPGHVAWVVSSVVFALAVTLVGDVVSYRRYAL